MEVMVTEMLVLEMMKACDGRKTHLLVGMEEGLPGSVVRVVTWLRVISQQDVHPWWNSVRVMTGQGMYEQI